MTKIALYTFLKKHTEGDHKVIEIFFDYSVSKSHRRKGNLKISFPADCLKISSHGKARE